MPRIPDHIADCTIYLYPSVDSAQNGENAGGSGFLAHVKSTVPGYGHLYAVTNYHVIEHGSCVLRLNNKAGGIDMIKTEYADWITHGDGDDIAVCPIRIDREMFRWWSVGTECFIDSSIIDAYNIGYGDEVFLVGRLVVHSGQQKNAIVVRFGNISLMADQEEPISHPEGPREGFLVECRSLSGFSGSPVFVTTTQDYGYVPQQKIEKLRQDRQQLRQPGEVVHYGGTFGPWLLGIDWGHIPLWKPVFEKDRKTQTDFMAEQKTGIACVAPAWKIMEVLNSEELIKVRKKEDKGIGERIDAAKTSSAVLDS